MYLADLHIENFRSVFGRTVVRLQPNVTVLLGENGAGKSNAVDAIRLLTDPLDDRRSRWWERNDMHRGCGAPAQISGVYRDLGPAESGTFIQALVPDPQEAGEQAARYSVSYAPEEGKRSTRPTWRAGVQDEDPEPEVRGRIRHVYLKPLRDAAAELASGSGTRLRVILEALLQTPEAIAEFEEEQRKLLDAMRTAPIQDAERKIAKPLTRLTEGAHPQEARLEFAEATLASVARALRARLADEGLDMQEITESGLGYANLLFIATVLVELDIAREADLTILLVEEPEAHLHPQLQTLLLDYLIERARESRQRPGSDPDQPLGHVQIVISSHSPVLAAATSVADVVVLKREAYTVPVATPGAAAPGASPPEASESLPRSCEHCGQAIPRSGDAAAPEPKAPERRFNTRAIAIASLGLSDLDLRKLDRYLDVTKSAMMFGPRVMLVEGIAEALLLPAFADVVIGQVPDKRDRERARARFRGTALVPIGGVDFEPYLKVLLTKVSGVCVAERVAIITDQDPALSYNRKDNLQAKVAALQAGGRCAVFQAEPTLEPELMRAAPGNAAVLQAVFEDMRPSSRDRWSAVVAADNPADAFGALFSPYKAGTDGVGLSKGEFAHLLAAQLTPTSSFTVPQYRVRRRLDHRRASPVKEPPAARAGALAQQQLIIAAAAPAVGIACPGAGKTYVMLERHARTPAGTRSRRGRALVSFTNVATTQIRVGCHARKRPDLVGFPHFIGTIDQFFWRFLVQPFHPGLHRLESWHELGVKAKVTTDRTVTLDNFVSRHDPRTGKCVAELGQGRLITKAISGTECTPQDFGDAAMRVRNQLMREGYVTAHEVRVLAARVLTTKPWAAKLLLERFFELVVDEAQDCSVLDVHLLDALAAAGLPLLAIGDPDQGIYEWRDADQHFLNRIAQRSPSYELTGNWRSSSTICRLASTLRTGGPARPPDTAVSDRDDSPAAVFLIPHGRGGSSLPSGSVAANPEAAVELFGRVMAAAEVPLRECLVLAHRGSDLPRCATHPGQRPPSGSTPVRLAWAAVTFADPTVSPAQRHRAIGVAQQVLCRWWWSETDQRGVAALCRSGVITTEQLRRRAAIFLRQLPAVDATALDAWCTAANKILKEQPLPSTAAPSQGRGRLTVRADGGKSICTLVGAVGPTPLRGEEQPRFSVVHQVKGAESPGVLLALPSQRARAEELLQAWSTQDPIEAETLRVLYVAVTRAQRLVALTYPAIVHNQLRALLQARAVPVRVVGTDYGCGLFEHS